MKFLQTAGALVFLAASCIVKADPYAELEPTIGAESTPEEFRELWKRYLDSDRLLKTKALEERYPETVRQSGYTKERCGEILTTLDDDIREHKMFLGLHRLAMRCHLMLDQVSEAEERAAFIGALAAFIAGSGKGDVPDSPLWIGMLADANDFLDTAGYEAMDRYFYWRNDGDDLVYRIAVRDAATRKESVLYFDVSYFLASVERQLLEGEDKQVVVDRHLVGKYRHVPALVMLAEAGDFAAMTGLAIWAERLFDRTQISGFARMSFSYYFAAAEAGSRFSINRLAAIAIGGKIEGMVERLHPLLLGAAADGDCEINKRLMAFYDLELLKGRDAELMDTLAAVCAQGKPRGEFYLEYAHYLDRYDDEYELRSDVVSDYMRLAGDAGNLSGYARLAQRHFAAKASGSDPKIAVELMRAAAEGNDPYALNYLGYLHESGEHVEKDIDKANEYYRRASALNFDTAMSNLGYNYLHGDGFEQNFVTAFEWFLKAAESGKRNAQYEVGRMYMFGVGVEQDSEQALRWIKLSADGGYEKAWIALGYAHHKGIGTPVDFDKARDWYHKAQQEGWALADINLDILSMTDYEPYMEVPGVDVYDEIIKRASTDDPIAIHAKGLLHLKGVRVSQSADLAKEHFIRAANLGVCYSAYHLGEDAKLKAEYRMERYRLAADLGCGGAAYKLAGMLYESGRQSEALEYYARAYELGEGRAAWEIGAAYEKGSAVEKDMTIALDWYRKGAKRGCMDCQTTLGWAYYQGKGVKRDVNLAIELYEQAADSGSSMAIRNLARIYTTTSEYRNPGKGVEWLLKDAHAKDGRALLELGKLYYFNDDLRNPQLAKTYLEESANRKNKDAMYWLAFIIEEVDSDNFELLSEAARIYEAAASWGLAAAQNNLGMMYLAGKGVEQDEDKAVDLFKEAAKKGSLVAATNLGWCYENGVGVRKRSSEAIKWYSKAARSDVSAALYRLYQLAVEQNEDVGQAIETLEFRFKEAGKYRNSYSERSPIVVPTSLGKTVETDAIEESVTGE